MKKKYTLFIPIFFCLFFGILLFNFQSHAATASNSDSSTYLKRPPIGKTIIIKNMKYKITGKTKATFLGLSKKILQI